MTGKQMQALQTALENATKERDELRRRVDALEKQIVKEPSKKKANPKKNLKSTGKN